MAITLTIPGRTHEEFGHSLNKLLRLLSDLHNSDGNHIILDFNNARMLNPFFLGGLACAIRHYEQKGKNFELIHQNNYNISSYLQAICFPGTFTPVPGSEVAFMETLEQYKEKRYIPIIAFPTGSDSAISQVRENVLSAV